MSDHICVECEHYSFENESHTCNHPACVMRSIITGEPLASSCASARYTGACGTMGKLWEPISGPREKMPYHTIRGQ